MAAPYDTSFKELVTHHFVSLLPWLLPEVRGGEVVRLSEELPATLRRADLIVRSERNGAPPALFLLECQCQLDADLSRDMLLRAALAHRQYRLPVETVLLAFTPQAATREEYVFGGYAAQPSRHMVRVRHIYDEPAEQALALGIAELLPLIPAMQPASGDRAALLSRILDRIIHLGSARAPGGKNTGADAGPDAELRPRLSDAQRRLMLDQAATFATLHLSRQKVQGIVRAVVERRHYMLDPIRDFPWLRAGYEEGIEKGLQRGTAQSVLAVLSARGISVDERLREKILGCQDQGRLDRYVIRAATARSAADVIVDE